MGKSNGEDHLRILMHLHKLVALGFSPLFAGNWWLQSHRHLDNSIPLHWGMTREQGKSFSKETARSKCVTNAIVAVFPRRLEVSIEDGASCFLLFSPRMLNFAVDWLWVQIATAVRNVNLDEEEGKSSIHLNGAIENIHVSL